MSDMIDLTGTKTSRRVYYYDGNEEEHTTRFPAKYITGQLEDSGELSFYRERRDGRKELRRGEMGQSMQDEGDRLRQIELLSLFRST